ncbi:MAG: hypothetical protein IKM18_04635 [Clostridia bacterium]|nr:hypothetical protein [Clostridia bacterium]
MTASISFHILFILQELTESSIPAAPCPSENYAKMFKRAQLVLHLGYFR